MAKTTSQATTAPTATVATTYAAAEANNRQLIAELATVDRGIADIAEKTRASGRTRPGESLVVGLPVQHRPEIPDPAPLVARRRDLEGAIKLQGAVLRETYGAMSRELSAVNAPQAKEKLATALQAMISARAALQDYKSFITRLNNEFTVTAPVPEVGIDPGIFGPDSSALSSLIIRTREALGIID